MKATERNTQGITKSNDWVLWDCECRFQKLRSCSLVRLQCNKLAIKIMFMSNSLLKVRVSGPASASWTTASAFLCTQLCVCLSRCRQKALTYVISSAGGEIQSLWRQATHNNDVVEALHAGEIFRQSKQTITTAGLCNKFSVPLSCPRSNKSSLFWNPSQQALCK